MTRAPSDFLIVAILKCSPFPSPIKCHELSLVLPDKIHNHRSIIFTEDAPPAMPLNVQHVSVEGVTGEPSPKEKEKNNPQTPPPLLPPPSAPKPPPPFAQDDERDFKRVGKMAYNWAIALLTISVVLLLTTPQALDHTERVFLYAAGTCLACLSLVTAVGLIYYSVLSHPGAQLAKVQERAMGFSAVNLVMAVIFRLALLIPIPLFLKIMAPIILLAGLLLLSIYLTDKIKAT
ncbi:uncharacterized protein LOC122043158 isoform X2 [Zingiber officinale]|nr:uncharacterized protein LOC122043158 isoform X2 [Zingiber officinale]